MELGPIHDNDRIARELKQLESEQVKQLEADLLVLEQHNDALEDQLTILQRRLKELEEEVENQHIVNRSLRAALHRAIYPEAK